MNRPEAAVYLDPFVERLTRMLDELDEEGLRELEEVWYREYERVRIEQNRIFTCAIVKQSGMNYQDIAEALGARGRSSVAEAMKGHISLDRFQRLVDFFAREIVLPPREERFVPATMASMSFVRERLKERTQHPISREVYEYVCRVTRWRDWWMARDAGDEESLESIAQELWAEVEDVIDHCEIEDLSQLVDVIDEWSPAYIICVDNLSEFGVD